MAQKIIFPIFIILALVQLYVPAKMILNNEDVLNTGKEYKFRTAPIDPNDPFRGKYISLRYEESLTRVKTDTFRLWERGQDIYVLLEQDSLGFAKAKSVYEEKPLNNNYVKAKVAYSGNSFFKSPESKSYVVRIDYPFDKFYMEESKALDAEKLYNMSRRRQTAKPAYALIRIKNGDAVLKDVMIEGISIKDIVKANQDSIASSKNIQKRY